MNTQPLIRRIIKKNVMKALRKQLEFFDMESNTRQIQILIQEVRKELIDQTHQLKVSTKG